MEATSCPVARLFFKEKKETNLLLLFLLLNHEGWVGGGHPLPCLPPFFLAIATSCISPFAMRAGWAAATPCLACHLPLYAFFGPIKKGQRPAYSPLLRCTMRDGWAVATSCPVSLCVTIKKKRIIFLSLMNHEIWVGGGHLSPCLPTPFPLCFKPLEPGKRWPPFALSHRLLPFSL